MEEQEKQEKTQKKQEQDNKKTQKLLNEISYRKEATLLALKYKTDEEKIFNFLAEFESFEIKDI
ncbi:MAG: hypothetical protein AB1498_01040 [bacterium]